MKNREHTQVKSYSLEKTGIDYNITFLLVSHAAFEHNERNILRRSARSTFLVPELCKLHAVALSIDATRIYQAVHHTHVCKLYTQQSKGPCAYNDSRART